MNSDGTNAPPPHDPGPGQPFPGHQQYPGPQQHPGPQQYPGPQGAGFHQIPGVPPRRGSGRSLFAGVALGVAATLIVGAVLVATNVLSFGGNDTADAGDDRPVELPAKLGPYTDVIEVLRTDPRIVDNYDTDLDAGQLEEFFDTNVRRAADAYQQSYRAPAGARTYANTDIQALVVGVRAGAVSPPLGFATDPTRPEIADLQRLERYGQVECVILDSSVLARPSDPGGTSGTTPTDGTDAGPTSGPITGDSDQSDGAGSSGGGASSGGTAGHRLTDTESAGWCQRSSDSLTVVVQGGAISDASTEKARAAMVDLADAAFDSLAG